MNDVTRFAIVEQMLASGKTQDEVRAEFRQLDRDIAADAAALKTVVPVVEPPAPDDRVGLARAAGEAAIAARAQRAADIEGARALLGNESLLYENDDDALHAAGFVEETVREKNEREIAEEKARRMSSPVEYARYTRAVEIENLRAKWFQLAHSQRQEALNNLGLTEGVNFTPPSVSAFD